IELVEQGPEHAGSQDQLAGRTGCQEIDELARLVAVTQLVALEQGAEHQVEAHTQLPKGLEARREAAMLEPPDRVGGQTAALGEDLLGHPPRASQAPNVTSKISAGTQIRTSFVDDEAN